MEKFDLPYLQIEPTTRCNYTCGFCVGRHMTQKNMDIVTFKRVLESVKNLKHISIQGEGEPLLHPDFFEMVRIVKMEQPQARISFITNGSLFTSETIRRILFSGINKILVSIESPKEEDFKEIRGGKLEKVLSGITALPAERKRQNLTKPLLGFAVTILRRTKTDYKGIVPLYHKLGMDGGMTLQLLQKMNAYSEIYNEAMKEQLLTAEDVLELTSEATVESSLFDTIKQNPNEPNFYEDLFSSKSSGCPWLSNGLYVNMDGIATGCCLIKDSDNEGFGAVNLSTIESVLLKRDEFQTRLFSRTIPKGCEGCSIAEIIQKRVSI